MSSSVLYRWSKAIGSCWNYLREVLRLGHNKPVIIQAYRGFGSRSFLFLRGRVLRDKSISKDKNDSTWRNMINAFKRFNSREVNAACIQISFQGKQFEVLSDSEGYFTLDTHLDDLVLSPSSEDDSHWQPALIDLLSIPRKKTTYQTAYSSEVLVPGEDVTYGIISDLDDTVLKTYVNSWLKWRMIYLTLLKNAFSRQAFDHVAAFYQTLRRGEKGDVYNPFFYVSNSPWNLYDFLEDFLDLNDLPRGPILLRDYGLPYEKRPADYRGHKHEHIRRILNLYPELPFVLIGDSGEKDALIYKNICLEYPYRIKAIYIRDVGSANKLAKIEKILKSIKGVPTKIAASYATIAAHAIENGLITQQAFDKMLKKYD